MMDKMGDTPGIKINDREKFRPEKLAQRCPVCNGFGTLKYGLKVCQACEGKGYVLIPAAITEEEIDKTG